MQPLRQFAAAVLVRCSMYASPNRFKQRSKKAPQFRLAQHCLSRAHTRHSY
jgi:hypothetical protein